MATIKSHTDIPQSKKLAGILPLESADMWWVALNWQETEYYVELKQDGINQPKKAIPCWSLAALLAVLHFPSLHKTISGWRCDTYKNDNKHIMYGKSMDNPIDACYEIIMRLNELNLL